jgi:3-methyladenine DNA glycosylase Tag
MTRFSVIRARAETRKGGPEALAKLLPPEPSMATLAALGDDRVLAEMTKRVFSAGFVWSVIEAKWPGFEAAFLQFEPAALAFQPDEFWEGLASDTRIIRNGAKIMAARHNALFVQDIAREHGGFGRFLAGWPPSDQIGLMALLAKRGSRLGGATGQMFLRFIGWGGFVLSRDVIACLRDAGLDIADDPKSKGDLARIQAQFNAWAEESGLSLFRLSRICAMSAGTNYEPERLMRYMGGGEEA